MTDAHAIDRHHKHMAELTQMGKHWHEKLWNGSGPWTGDRFLNIYHRVLTDDIEVRYEVPNERSQLVLTLSLADFDIDLLCLALAKGDNRTSTVEEKIEAADAANAALDKERAYDAEQQQGALIDKLKWAVRTDTDQHVKPITPGRVLNS